jgi:hypothetical protein
MKAEIPFKIKNGTLEGPNGSWKLSAISAVYKRECGQIGLKKWLVTVAGLAAAGSIASGPIIPTLAIAGGTFGYMMHRTMRVFATINGVEVEIHCEVYFDPWINVQQANAKCDALISLIKKEL